jgi:hypothetical protein
MGEIIQGVNWLAVGAGAVISFVLGFLWYSPLMFGKRWAEGVGVEAGARPSAAALITQLLGLFLMSWFIGVAAVIDNLAVAILAVAAFSVLFFSAGLFTRKDPFVRNIEVGHWIVSLVVMQICQVML